MGLRSRSCGKGRKHAESSYVNKVINRNIKEASSPVHKADFLQKLAELPDNLLWGQTPAKLLAMWALGPPDGFGGPWGGYTTKKGGGKDSVQHRQGQHGSGTEQARCSPNHLVAQTSVWATAEDRLRGWRGEKLAPRSKIEEPEWSQCREGVMKDGAVPMSWPGVQAISSCTE